VGDTKKPKKNKGKCLGKKKGGQLKSTERPLRGGFKRTGVGVKKSAKGSKTGKSLGLWKKKLWNGASSKNMSKGVVFG